MIMMKQILFFCLCCWLGIQTTHSKFSSSSTILSTTKGRSRVFQETLIVRSALQDQTKIHPEIFILRGGSDDEDETEDESEDIEDDESPTTGVDVSFVIEKVGSISKKVVVFAGKVAIQTAKAFQRGIQAGLQGDDDNDVDDDDADDVPTPMVTKVLKTVKRMIKAALTFPDEESEDDTEEEDVVVEVAKKKRKKATSSSQDGDEEEEDDKEETSTASASVRHDFGTFLSKSYGVSDDRGDSESIMLGGNLANALKLARSEARMLVVFIPVARPSKKSKKSKDQLAIESVLSSEVGKAANKRARKGGEGTGSFLLWGAKMGSSEATTAIKRLKGLQMTSSTGEKRPILAVVYPGQVLDGSGLKTVPKLLAQHHCSPPPTPALMAAWLDSLRKRYSKQYRIMQTELKEAQYYKERKEGYKDSMQNDAEREKREKEEAVKKAAEEKAEKERIAAIETRRKELKESLPEEPTSGDFKKVAVRFADGRSGQRRFSSDEPLSSIFNWVDVIYEMEREKVTLTTMNGKQTFTWDEETNDKSLADAGLGKMAGFRVSETTQSDDESSDDADSEES